MTHAHVIEAIACVSPPDAATAAVFCEFIGNLAGLGGSPGRAVLHEAGAIPIVFDCLRSWPTSKEVVSKCCSALHSLALFGGTDMKQAMRDVPDCEALLKAAQASELEKKSDGSSVAADVWNKLLVKVCLYLLY
jgi:hypothetical protein